MTTTMADDDDLNVRHKQEVELTEYKENGGEHDGKTHEIKPLVIDDDDDESLGHSAAAGQHHGTMVPGTASNAQVAANIVISFVGAGLLGMPNAFRQAGWLLGSIALCTVSALNVYSMLLLPNVQRALIQQKKGHCRCYGSLGRAVLGERGEAFVNLCLVVSQAGFATAYIIFIAANLYSIWQIPRMLVCFGCVPGLCLLVQAREMKTLSPFSLLADFANLAGLSAVLFEDFESYEPHNDTIHPIQWQGFLYVVAITIYSMEGVGLILSLEASCQNRSHFPWLLKTVLAGITLFMAFFGSAGYAAFGNQTQAPITLNLTGSFAATFVKSALCLALYLTYPVMMFPIWSITEGLLPRLTEHAWMRILFRCLPVLLSSLVAYSVPDFGKFLSLVGSSICTILGFILPCYFHLHVMRKEIPFWQICLDGFIIIAATLFGILGTYNSFVALWSGEEGDMP